LIQDKNIGYKQIANDIYWFSFLLNFLSYKKNSLKYFVFKDIPAELALILAAHRVRL